MKKLVALFLIFALILSLSACSWPERPVEEEESKAVTDVNELRPDFNLWECRDLSGSISVVLLYMDDFSGGWTAAKANKYTEEEVRPALRFLEKYADSYGKQLEFEIVEQQVSVYYDGEVEVDTRESGYATVNVLWVAATALGYGTEEDYYEACKSKYGNEEVIFLTVFNKMGNCYGLNPRRGHEKLCVEHGICFVYDSETASDPKPGQQASTIARTILYLYGAESLAADPDRKKIADPLYKNDIMMRCAFDIDENYIGRASAFYIGWIDTAPKPMYNVRW